MARISKKLYDIEYNGRKASELGAFVLDRPNIPSPVKNMTTYTVPGRDGVLTQWDGSYAPITIEGMVGFHARESDWMEKCRSIRAWLLSDGDHILRLGDDSGYFYKVVTATAGTAVRRTRLVGEIPVSFLCDPYAYLDDGLLEHDYTEVADNPYDTCHPVFKIGACGRSDCYLFVNGARLYFDGAADIIIDTDRMVSYAPDGSSLNAAVAGDYEALYLKPGQNDISLNWSYDCKIIPNWRKL